MKTNLLHYGLQRSGTNFFENLILKNFEVRFLNSNKDRAHPVQKHFRLYDEKLIIPEKKYYNDLFFSNFNDFHCALNLKKEYTGVIIVSKDPYSWYLSYLKWAKKCNWPTPKHHYILEYNLFYKKWLDFSEENSKIIFVKYSDFLKSPDKVLKDLEYKFDLTAKKKNFFSKKINKVPQSKKFNIDQKDYYLNRDYMKKIDKNTLNIINNILDIDVITRLGYQQIN